VHVTTHLRPEIPSLRGPALRAVIERCFEEGCERFGFRLVHYSIQSSHLHILAESKTATPSPAACKACSFGSPSV
jgi:REP element-mobilizing transposase RayT